MKKALLSLSAAVFLLAGGMLAWFMTEFQITLQSSAGGTLYCETVSAHPFQKVKIYIAPEENRTAYALERITVNGEDCTDEVTRACLTLDRVWGDKVVEATFSEQQTPAAPAFAVFV